MIITKEWLKGKSACEEGIKWFIAQEENDAIKVLEKLIKENQLSWANWTICRVFNYKQRVQYAVFAAEQVIEIYEKQYPDNKKPREAIDAAKKCIENPSEENKSVAYAASVAVDAADAAYAAADAASVAAAAYAAANAAYAAATAAAVAYAAAAVVDAYADAADAAAYAADAVNATDAAYALRKKILEYGISLLKG